MTENAKSGRKGNFALRINCEQFEYRDRDPSLRIAVLK